MTAVPCSTPGKVRYATPITARRSADRDTAIHGTRHTPYPCECGWWHTTTSERDRKIRVARDGTVYARKKRKAKPTAAKET